MTTETVMMVCGTFAAAAAAVASAIAAGRSLRMAKLAAEPVVALGLDWDEKGDHVYVIVKNIGQSPAYYISLEASPDLKSGDDGAGNRTPIRWGSFSTGIGNLYPGMERSIGWAPKHTVNNDLITTKHCLSASYYVDPSISKKQKHQRRTGCELAFDMLPVKDGLVHAIRDGLGGCKRSIENLPRLQRD